MIELKGINGDNIEDVVALQVTLEQETFLQTTNLKSVADAHMLRTDGIDATLLAIYNDDIVIGFAMYIYDVLDHESFQHELFYNERCYFIWHYMLDQRYQQQGFGRLSFEQLLAQMKQLPHSDAHYIALFYDERNEAAASLYASCGFIATAIRQERSILAIKSLNV